ncbi:glycosyltransferase [Flavobacteriales bacterium]|nr:glycosyltransferase [Flavobacteriales bacterium]
MKAKENIEISIITVNYNGAKDTIEMVNSVVNSDVENVEIIIVDNASQDSDVQSLRQMYAKSSVVTLIESVKKRWVCGR